MDCSIFGGLKKFPSKYKFGKNKCELLTIDHEFASIMAEKIIKNADSIASFSSVTAATKYSGFSDSSFKMA